jgi:hypothetical protein
MRSLSYVWVVAVAARAAEGAYTTPSIVEDLVTTTDSPACDHLIKQQNWVGESSWLGGDEHGWVNLTWQASGRLPYDSTAEQRPYFARFSVQLSNESHGFNQSKPFGILVVEGLVDGQDCMLMATQDRFDYPGVFDVHYNGGLSTMLGMELQSIIPSIVWDNQTVYINALPKPIETTVAPATSLRPVTTPRKTSKAAVTTVAPDIFERLGPIFFCMSFGALILTGTSIALCCITAKEKMDKARAKNDMPDSADLDTSNVGQLRQPLMPNQHSGGGSPSVAANGALLTAQPARGGKELITTATHAAGPALQQPS